MNFLFLMKVYEVGGQEVVTSILAKSFVSNGHHVVIASFQQPNEIMVKRTDDRIHFFTIGAFKYNKANVNTLRSILLTEKIDIIINQWGLPYVPIKVARAACKNTEIKIISVYHNNPATNARIQSCDTALAESSNVISKSIISLKRLAFKFVTSRSMRYVYEHSDLYMVLSPSFLEPFCEFTKIKDRSKLIVQTNPVTIETPSEVFDYSIKQKEVLYVGRIDCNQKRVERIIHVWSQIEKVHPDWVLTIVGDGPDKQKMENLAENLSLRNISFVGFKNPTKYYKKASLLLLTSDFEGFGLVIVEGMSWGVVPIVYGSYTAVYDIISNKKDGIIVPPLSNGDFDEILFQNEIERLMNNEVLRKELAGRAIIKSSKFSITSISDEWVIKSKKMLTGGVIKEIIYVGRLDNNQKKVNRILILWSLLEKNHTNWRLYIVGDGPDRENLKHQAMNLNLTRVSFEGFQNPIDYYKRASILVLTSDFEGFPLVLAECMSFGVVPIVYGSYSAVYDIIKDKVNGRILSPKNGQFNTVEMASILSEVMADNDVRNAMALCAIETSKEYSIDSIYEQWMTCLKKLDTHI